MLGDFASTENDRYCYTRNRDVLQRAVSNSRFSWLVSSSRLTATLRQLQVEPSTLSVDKHNTVIDELLAGAIVGFIAAKGFHGKEKLDSQRLCSWYTWLCAATYRGAEADAVEVLVAGEVCEHSADERRDVFVKSQRSEFITRGLRRFSQNRGHGEFKVNLMMKCNKRRRSIGDEMRLRFELL